MSPILGIIASQDYSRVTNSYESIATAVGTGSSGTITFSSIPSTYTHLQLRVISRGTASANDAYFARFNSDSGGNYYQIHVLYGNGSAAGAFASGTSSTLMQPADIVGSSSTANSFAANVTDILDYSNTNKYKTVRTLYGFDTNGAGVVALNSNLWMSTSAITSITLTTGSGSFATNSHFALYGIKGA
jgi:hypothetical protein